MKKMPGHPRLFRRGAVYWFRAAVPVDLKKTYPKREETFSLRTKDYQEALKKVRLAAVEVDQRFEDHRHGIKTPFSVGELSREAINRLAELRFHEVVSQHDKARRELMDAAVADFPQDIAPEKPAETKDEAKAIVDAYRYKKALEERRKRDFERRRSVVDEWREGVDTALSYAKEAFSLVAYDLYEPYADELLAQEKVQLSKSAASYPALVKALLAAEIRGIKACLAEYEGLEEVEIRDEEAIKADIQTAIGANTGPELLKEANKWGEDQLAAGIWTPKTKRANLAGIQRFAEFAGDRGIGAYSKAEAREFRALLLKLPANAHLGRLRGLNIVEAVALAEKLETPPMSRKNASKIFSFVGAFFRYAVAAYDEIEHSPFIGLSIRKGQSDEKARTGFTSDELTRIFEAPVFTGCESPKNWTAPGKYDMRDTGRYWIPLIALFTGCRLSEIVQLYIRDIRTENEITFFDINDTGDKTLKTRYSKRLIPVHPELVKVGFLDFVERQRQAGETRLFPELTRSKTDGSYSFVFSKWFARFLRETGVKRRRNCFHSFRHGFEDACRDAGLSGDLTDALQGHKLPGMRGVYGEGFKLDALAEAVEQINYKSLDLSPLYQEK